MLIGDDVAHHDLVAELGEAGAGDEADPARAEDCDPLSLSLMAGRRIVVAYADLRTFASGRRPFAIAIIVSF